MEADRFRGQSSKWNDCRLGGEQPWVRCVEVHPEFKAEAVELLINSGKPIAEIAGTSESATEH